MSLDDLFEINKAPRPHNAAPKLTLLEERAAPLTDGQYFLKDNVIYRYFDGESYPKLGLPGNIISFPRSYTPEQIEAERPSRIAGDRDKRAKFDKLSSLIQMRDLVLIIMDLQEENADEDLDDPANPPWAPYQAKLKELYNAFVRTYGQLHKIGYRGTGQFNKDFVQTETAYYPNLEDIKKDPHASRLAAALEKMDHFSDDITAGPIFDRRWITPYTPISSADTLEKAIQISMEQHGKIDAQKITFLLEGPDSADDLDRQGYWIDRASQEGLIFLDPETKQWMEREDYLQGNIYQKLERAKKAEAAAKHVSYQNNIEVLQDHIPEPVRAESIPAELRMHWIPADIIEKFAKDELGLSDVSVNYISSKNKWFVTGEIKDVDAATHKYGTYSQSSLYLLKEILGEIQEDSITTLDDDQDDDHQPDSSATNSYGWLKEQKKERIQQRFSEWLWEDPKRRALMEERFNKMFNARRQRPYKDKTMNFPGAAVSAPALRWNQMEGAVRNIEGGDTGHFQPPGAGKTDLAVTLIHELRRRGLVKKPIQICPNPQIVRQFESAHIARYPRDKIKVIDDVYDSEGKKLAGHEKLKRLAKIIREGDYDAIYMTQSVFDRFHVHPEARLKRYLNEYFELKKGSEDTNFNNWRAASYAKERLVDVKKNILLLTGRLTEEDVGISQQSKFKNAGAKDDVLHMVSQHWDMFIGSIKEGDVPADINNPFWQDALISYVKTDVAYFDEMGADWLGIDESHAYKNLEIHSEHLFVGLDGSKRARSLLDKVNYLRDIYPANKHHVSMMTATPLTNNPLYEVYTILRLLDPEALETAEIECFDSFLAMFGRKERAIELSPNGVDYRTAEHFSRFKNIELLRSQFDYRGHIIQEKDLGLKRPKIQYDSVVIEPSDRMAVLMEWFKERHDAVLQGRSLVPNIVDNPLNIINDGRMASITPDLVWHKYVEAKRAAGEVAYDPREFEDEDFAEYTKLDAAADYHARIYHANKDQYLSGPDETSDPVPGILQMNFCDIGVPKSDGSYSVYDDLRQKLIDRVVPAGQIKFIHDYDNPSQKALLERECNTGKVSILICSSEKAARGLNIQRRAGAIGHLSVPWTDDWLTQRNGRMDRPGAWIDIGDVCHFITKGSYDEFSWQKLQLKAEEIYLFMNGKPVDYNSPASEQIQYYRIYRALAARDPRLLQLVELEQQSLQLIQLQEQHEENKRRAQLQRGDLREKLGGVTTELKFLEALQRQNLSDSAPLLDLGGQRYPDEYEAQEALAALLRDRRKAVRDLNGAVYQENLGSVMGAPLSLKARYGSDTTSAAGNNAAENKNYSFELYIGSCQTPIILTQNDIKAAKEIPSADKGVAISFAKNAQEVAIPSRGLVIGKAWSEGEVTWELRKQPTKIRERVAIIDKASKTIVATADVADCKGPLEPEVMLGNLDLLRQTQDETEKDIEDGYVYAWELNNPVWLEKPIPYDASLKMQSWVNLAETFNKSVKGKFVPDAPALGADFNSQATEVRMSFRAKVIDKFFTPLQSLSKNLAALRQSVREMNAQIETATHIVDEPFAKKKELTSSRRAYAKLKRQMKKSGVDIIGQGIEAERLSSPGSDVSVDTFDL